MVSDDLVFPWDFLVLQRSEFKKSLYYKSFYGECVYSYVPRSICYNTMLYLRIFCESSNLQYLCWFLTTDFYEYSTKVGGLHTLGIWSMFTLRCCYENINYFLLRVYNNSTLKCQRHDFKTVSVTIRFWHFVGYCFVFFFRHVLVRFCINTFSPYWNRINWNAAKEKKIRYFEFDYTDIMPSLDLTVRRRQKSLSRNRVTTLFGQR